MMDQVQTLSVLDLPDSLLLKVFMSPPLQRQSVRCVSLTCSRFSRVARDPQLWKTMFQRDFKVPQSVPLRPKASSWRAEYRRLYDESPAVMCEEVLGHKDEVLNVTFSHNGAMFATCSKDGLVKVWEATTPCTLRFSADLNTRLTWRYTTYSQFNESDSLLLVAGVLGDTGEVVIFDLNQDFKLLSRILSRPFSVFGTWFDDHHIISGTLHPTDFISSVWLAKATREVKSTRKYDVINPYRFQILTNGGIRGLMVADAPIQTVVPTSTSVGQFAACSEFGLNDPHSDLNESHLQCDDKMPNHRNQVYECGQDAAGCSVHASVPFIQNTTTSSPSTHNRSITSCKSKPALDSPQVRSSVQTQKEKLLIFTYGEVFFHSHVVGIKRMREDEILEEEEATEGLRWPETEGFLLHTHSDVSGTGRLSNPDYSFNMYGRIIGMALSPDQRYLYVNTRRWTEDYVIGDENEPPVADEIDVIIISLMTYTKVDTVLRSHKAFVPNHNFLLFLDVNELCVASGSVDNQGYMWDRHYGVHVRCFPHDDIVSSCAFNPVDPEMLVTVSDDMKIKIWRSRRQMREQAEGKQVYKYETATTATVADKHCLEGRDNSDTLSGRRETTREDCNCSVFLCCFRK